MPILPDDPTGFRRALEDYPYFEPAAFTAADRDRAGQYRARARAAELAASAGSLEDYQASLGMRRGSGGDRRAQRRPRGAAHQQDQPVQPHHPPAQPGRARGLPRPARARVGLQVRLADRFADHGLIAVALAEVRKTTGPRARDRHPADELPRARPRRGGAGAGRARRGSPPRPAAPAVTGSYVPTGRNGMVADLYPRHGFAEAGEGRRARPAGPPTPRP